jgi:voltage-gated potassium channel Kch
MAGPEVQQEGESAGGATGASPSPAAESPCTACQGMEGHAIIAGYGIPGRAVAEALKAQGISYCVVELNADTVRRCLRGGVRIFGGDATSEAVLRQAGIERAVLFAATMPNDHAVIEAVAQARRLNPAVRILARCEYVSNGLKATRRGANQVVVAEQVVGQAFKTIVEATSPPPPPPAGDSTRPATPDAG